MKNEKETRTEKEISEQTEIDTSVLNELFTNEKLSTGEVENLKEYLRDKFVKKENIDKLNGTSNNYFNNTYKYICKLYIIKKDQLNNKYAKVYNINGAELSELVNTILIIFQNFRSREIKAQKLSKQNVNDDNKNTINMLTKNEAKKLVKKLVKIEFKKVFKQHLDKTKKEIKELLERFINNSDKSVKDDGKDIIRYYDPSIPENNRLFFFRVLLARILRSDKQTITYDEIVETFNPCNIETKQADEKDNVNATAEEIKINKNKNNIIYDIIKVLLLLKVLEKDKPDKVKDSLDKDDKGVYIERYTIYDFAENDWHMNAETKIDSIAIIVGELTNRTYIFPEDIASALSILDFQNKQ